MAFFSKKTDTDVDEIIKAIKNLSTEELEKVFESLSDINLGANEHEEQETKPLEETEAFSPEEKADKNSENESDKPAVEQENEETGEQQEESDDDGAKVIEALEARISALESNLAEYADKLANVVDKLDGGDFGQSPDVPQNTDDDKNDDERIMKAYYRGNYRR